MPKPSHLAALGVAKETTKGTAVVPTMWIPWKALTPKDDVHLIDDKGQRGAAVESFGIVQGQKGSTLDFGGDVFADSIGFPLVSLLPDVAVTGASAPYTTTFSVLNTGDTQPPGQTYTIFDPLGTWQYPGEQLSELSFKWNADGLFEYSAKATGWTYVTTTSPTVSNTAVKPVANWTTLTKIAGTTIFVIDGELTIKRAVTAIRGANGSQNPYAIWSGDLAVEGKLTLVMEDSSQRTIFQNSTAQSLDVSFSAGAGASATGLQLHCTTAVWSDGTPSYGKDYIELPVSFKTYANATDIGASGGYSPIKVTLTNAMPSGTYK